jgi:transcriptional regulator with XRE-family HTH domain
MDVRHYDPAKLAEARKVNNLTQQDVANALNVDRQTIYRAESGITASYEILAALCKLYKLPMTAVILPYPDIALAN